MDYKEIFELYKETRISGRYITNKHIEPLLENLNSNFQVETIGTSVLHKPIYGVSYGVGKIKIFMWSQMHGNEGTTTKALFDLFNLLQFNSQIAQDIYHNYQLKIIPILNPDGAEEYTRMNANLVDLNRDSVNLSQPEAQLLRNVFDNFQPDYCFNLHDQRTIFGAGSSGKPATVSFLAPAFDEARTYNSCRLKAVAIINEMHRKLQELIPNQIGCFDDAFNLNCIGDRFQSLGVPTILFEAGHFPNDYQREETRKYIFIAYISALQFICKENFDSINLEEYLHIPQNKTVFYDFIYKNIRIKNDSLDIITNFAAHYREILDTETIRFQAEYAEIGNLEGKFGHIEYDLSEGLFTNESGHYPVLGEISDFSVNINNIFVNGVKNN